MDSFFVAPGANKRQKSDGPTNGFSSPRQPPGRGRGGRGGNSQRGGPRGRGRSSAGRGGPRGAMRGRANGAPANATNGIKDGKKRFRAEEEEILSDESGAEEAEEQILLRRDEEDREEDEETEQEKRLRLTKDYIQQLEEATAGDDKDVGDQLRDEVLDSAGRLRRPVAKEYSGYDEAAVRVFRGHNGHKLAVACVTSNGTIIFSGGKEGTIIKWDVATGKMLKKIALDKTDALGHSGAVLCLALSSDSKFLASGSSDKIIKIWTVADMELYCVFKGHRDLVSGVAFRMNSHELFSCGHDRNVKVWNVDEKAYVETLFGHQNAVCAIDSFYKERCVTAGGQDSSVRIWKILEESQLVFQLPSGSLECISLIDDDHFVTGGDDGSVALWGAHKKKPIYTVRQAHRAPITGEACWVTAIDALKNSDIFASGSHSGEIKVWIVQDGFRGIQLHFTIPVRGFVNSLRFVMNGEMLIAGVGQEHRLGRWWRATDAKNSVCLFTLKKVVSDQPHSDEVER
ncbi:U3 small nucleolar RNA-interacting protein 2 [Hypsibius exemplaris]|uniref:U3 small nucleolar RNA-interacting protein 2 n=1 Tax=Hypsibius exemplaris TaxID=2072580 RepID=A0A1W0WWK9_HYPEX|nr:U3 small nucleolar RNA-interacting protein 2 [Hypsibius exemplaris]